MLKIVNLQGAFTGAGFGKHEGRHPTSDDCGFLSGPLDLVCCKDSGQILELVPSGQSSTTDGSQTIDGRGLFATSAFLDSHTHSLFAGDRSAEFFARWAGKSYREISDAGGGISTTIRATSQESTATLASDLRQRLRSMKSHGTGVVEIKTGYGHSAADEIRLLQIIRDVRHSPDLPEVVPTFLGLHSVPTDVNRVGHVDSMIAELRTVSDQKLARFVDSFPEQGFYSYEEATRFIQAAVAYGIGVKLHADEITDMGASLLGIESGAASIDHLEHIADVAVRQLGHCSTVATVLPATSLFLGIGFANARRLIDAGSRVALATDFNPGTAPASDLQLTMLLGAASLKMTAAEIFCAVTYNAAAALSLTETHGMLLPGMTANIALWNSHRKEITSPGLDVLERMIVHRESPATMIVKGMCSQAL